jgi:CheY-like chemotaxis protein
MPEQPKKILLFEDDYESMYMLKDYLETDLGYEVTLTAEKSLLERLGHERFDLILVDWMIHSTSLNEAGEEIVNVHFEGVSWSDAYG